MVVHTAVACSDAIHRRQLRHLPEASGVQPGFIGIPYPAHIAESHLLYLVGNPCVSHSLAVTVVNPQLSRFTDLQRQEDTVATVNASL